MKSRHVKMLIGMVVAGIALLALAPIAAAAGAAGFGARDGSGPITDASFGPVGFANRAGQVGEMSDTASMLGGPRYSLVAVAAAQLKMERTDLVAELRSGKTIAQVAKEHNVAANTIVDAFVAVHAEQLKTLTADGRITQAEADEMLTAARAHATEQINEQWTQWAGNEGSGMRLQDGSCGGLGPQAGR